MSHRAEVRTVAAYAGVVALIFFAAYVVLGTREMGLYVVLMLLNLPASVAVVPYMESFAQAQGWELGHPLHVWSTQLACLAVNEVLLGALMVVVMRMWQFFRGGRRAA